MLLLNEYCKDFQKVRRHFLLTKMNREITMYGVKHKRTDIIGIRKVKEGGLLSARFSLFVSYCF